jgi:septum formation protein
MALARAKARAVAQRVSAEVSGRAPGRTVVLGADTEVFLEGQALGKPADAAAAGRMLRALRGRVHEVITGLALVEVGGGREETASVTTRVRMAEYSDEVIESYVTTGEPFDKAGGYAVQGEGGRLVAEVDGCFTNVVGLPVETTRRLLAAWGLRG